MQIAFVRSQLCQFRVSGVYVFCGYACRRFVIPRNNDAVFPLRSERVVKLEYPAVRGITESRSVYGWEGECLKELFIRVVCHGANLNVVGFTGIERSGL